MCGFVIAITRPGAFDREAVERQLIRLVEQEHPARWGRYHPVAIDDTYSTPEDTLLHKVMLIK